MSRGAGRDAEAGFTLVEMLVSLLLSSIVGLAAFGTLSTVIGVRDRTEGRLERVAAIDRALLLVGQDLGQGDAAGLALEDGFLAITSARGPRLSYGLEDGRLVRSAERADGADPLEQPLLDTVGAVDWRVLGDEAGWAETWPPPTGETRARAVELMLTVAGTPGTQPVTVRRVVPLAEPVTP